jgi:hypothetical protein
MMAQKGDILKSIGSLLLLLAKLCLVAVLSVTRIAESLLHLLNDILSNVLTHERD